MQFILILMLANMSHDYPAVAVATFHDEASCRAAGEAAVKASPVQNTTYVCVPAPPAPPLL